MRPWFNAARISRTAATLTLAAMVGGCAGGVTPTAPITAPPTTVPGPTPSPTAEPTPTPAPTAPPLTGTFEANGHELNIVCQGGPTTSDTPSPTIIYFHGMSPEPPDSGVNHGSYIAPFLAADYRYCAYDRANIGGSDTIEGKQTAHDAVVDLHALLQSAHVPGPYVLLGASFGGLVAYEYAVTYPDDVVGMVVLDPTLPREYLDIDPFFHPDDGQLTGEEWRDNLEHMDWLGSMQETQVLEGTEPKIPLTYFALKDPMTWWHPVTPESIAAYRTMQHRFVDLWSPGLYVEVDTEHYMEPRIPDQIADAVRDVIRAALSAGLLE